MRIYKSILGKVFEVNQGRTSQPLNTKGQFKYNQDTTSTLCKFSTKVYVADIITFQNHLLLLQYYPNSDQSAWKGVLSQNQAAGEIWGKTYDVWLIQKLWGFPKKRSKPGVAAVNIVERIGHPNKTTPATRKAMSCVSKNSKINYQPTPKKKIQQRLSQTGVLDKMRLPLYWLKWDGQKDRYLDSNVNKQDMKISVWIWYTVQHLK